MRATSISVTVRYSRPLADGSHKTVELSCEASITNSEETWQAAQATLYRQLGEQMHYVWTGNGKGSGQKGTTPETPASKPDHYCEEHQTEYQRFSKDGKVWYSHKPSDGKWCSEK